MEQLERYAPLAAVAAAVCWLLGVVVLEVGGNPAAPSPEDLLEYFRDSRTPILLAVTVHGLGSFFFLWFVAWLRSRLRLVPGGDGWLGSAAFAGGIAGAALLLGLMGPHGTGATTDVELLGPETSVVLWRLSHVFFVGAEIALAVFVLALSLLALSRVVLARWVGWTGIVVVAVLLVPPLGWISLLFLLPLWLAALGVAAFLRPGLVRLPAGTG